MTTKLNLAGILLIVLVISAALGCKREVEEVTAGIIYNPTPYIISTNTLPPPPFPKDNLPTEEGVKLGQMLFHETMLSGDNTQSCADCHRQADAFTDTAQFSTGIEGLLGGRQAMIILNMAWHKNGFFWDGRAPLLRDQSLKPIQDPLEMNATLEDVVAKLSNTQMYVDQFTRAFGDGEITPLKMSLAMEQFMNIIISDNSKYDQFLLGEVELSESEQRGMDLFFNEYDPLGIEKGAECFHCHGGINFTNDAFMNNGLDTDGSFEDMGLASTTNSVGDLAKFKVPSLRNVALSGPYMHDGRFTTLEEVIEHYNSEVLNSSTVDDLMQFNLDPGLELTSEDIEDLVNFMHTLTDETFVNNPEFANPF
jgi:cytochrome c peroxidase